MGCWEGFGRVASGQQRVAARGAAEVIEAAMAVLVAAAVAALQLVVNLVAVAPPAVVALAVSVAVTIVYVKGVVAKLKATKVLVAVRGAIALSTPVIVAAIAIVA